MLMVILWLLLVFDKCLMFLRFLAPAWGELCPILVIIQPGIFECMN